MKAVPLRGLDDQEGRPDVTSPSDIGPDGPPDFGGPASPANGEYREPMGEARKHGVDKRNAQRQERAQQREARPTPPDGWHLIAPTEAVVGDGLLRPDGSIVILDDTVFERFPVEVRRGSWAVRGPSRVTYPTRDEVAKAMHDGHRMHPWGGTWSGGKCTEVCRQGFRIEADPVMRLLNDIAGGKS